MADGHSRTTGNIGVATVTCGGPACAQAEAATVRLMTAMARLTAVARIRMPAGPDKIVMKLSLL